MGLQHLLQVRCRLRTQRSRGRLHWSALVQLPGGRQLRRVLGGAHNDRRLVQPWLLVLQRLALPLALALSLGLLCQLETNLQRRLRLPVRPRPPLSQLAVGRVRWGLVTTPRGQLLTRKLELRRIRRPPMQARALHPWIRLRRLEWALVVRLLPLRLALREGRQFLPLVLPSWGRCWVVIRRRCWPGCKVTQARPPGPLRTFRLQHLLRRHLFQATTLATGRVLTTPLK